MLQVLLTILKILGILILVILGIILTVLLLVLFVPLRYRGDASFDGKPKGGILVSWMLRLITVRVDYDGSALTAVVKVLWFKLFEQKLWPEEEALEEMPSTVVSKKETVKVEEIKPETVKPDTVKPETVKPDTVKSETVKTVVNTRSGSTERKIQKQKMPTKESTSVSAAEKTPFLEKLYTIIIINYK